MADFSELVKAVNEGQAEAARGGILAALASTDASSDAGGWEVTGLAFDIGDWLFEKGQIEAASQVYRAALEKAKALDERSGFNAARHYDAFAQHLERAGKLAEAAEALKTSIALSESSIGLDARAYVWRQEQLARLQEQLGESVEISTPLKEAAAEIARRFGLRELSSTTLIESEAGMEPPRLAFAGIIGAERYRLIADGVRNNPAEDDKYLKVRVHFATHRLETPGATSESYDPYNRFGAVHNGKLTFGQAIVTVPAKRVPGYYREPSASWFGGSTDKAVTFTVQTIDVYRGEGADGECVSGVKEDIGRSRRRELLVFLHGYRTSFASGLMRAAQLQADMKIDGGVFLYSLPSQGSFWGYRADRKNAVDQKAPKQLRDFLVKLSEESGATRIHLLGHSLGCEMLYRTLNEICEKDGDKPKRRFEEIIFASPDADRDSYYRDAPQIAQLGRRTTVYCSESDIPLSLIGWIDGVSRAGFDASALAGIPGLEAIDTTNGRSWFSSLFNGWGHQDFADASIDDVRAVAWLSLSPPARKCELVAKTAPSGAVYWAVEGDDGELLKIFRQALEYARQLGLEKALETAQSSVEAEQHMIPQGERLAEFQALYNELLIFRADGRSG